MSKVHYVQSYRLSTLTACKRPILKPMSRAEGGDWDLVTCKSCLKKQYKHPETVEPWVAGFDQGREFEQKSFHRTMDRLGIKPAEKDETACARMRRTIGDLSEAFRNAEGMTKVLAELRERIRNAHKALSGQ